MATNEPSRLPTTNQVTTDNIAPDVVGTPPMPDAPDLYGPQGPDPSGTEAGAVEEMEKEEETGRRIGVEGEEVVWEGRYVTRNFIGRLIVRGLLAVAWLVLAIYTWGYHHRDMLVVTIVTGIVVAVLWLMLGYRMILARYGHYYRLTTRRLFVSTGMLQRRRDQMELLRVADVYTRQDWTERLLSLGTVVVVSSEKALPTVYLPGVDDPKRVMDLIWHYARAERDKRSVKVQEL
jgi:membrane protein YdbS with pleckstrin-like domain